MYWISHKDLYCNTFLLQFLLESSCSLEGDSSRKLENALASRKGIRPVIWSTSNIWSTSHPSVFIIFSHLVVWVLLYCYMPCILNRNGSKPAFEHCAGFNSSKTKADPICVITFSFQQFITCIYLQLLIGWFLEAAWNVIGHEWENKCSAQ